MVVVSSCREVYVMVYDVRIKNKNSYIDSYLQRGVNATEVSVGLN